MGLQPDGMGRRLHISRHRFSYPYSRFAAHVEKADASKEMQRRRMGMITNFLLSPLVNLVWDDQEVVNFAQILIANGRMVDLTEAPAQRGRAVNSTF